MQQQEAYSIGTFARHEVVAVLGPTNTGKTHRAIERMLDHDSGMIGLPLRLLAREVYDRVVARVGESEVALLTGEEKRIPKRPRYWIATVEAMPMDREVDFLAVDEIQLCGHPERGHVFTERLLHARGQKETWFLGSHTVEGLLKELVPIARVESHPRLSSLRFTRGDRLGRLPKRSAVVAFSMNEVYRLAERIRSQHGGAAVVMGALSPRTRNAQVALFEAGEVDYLVATDAIGMGLNLDVHHVAFGALSKFDGREERELEPQELAQIAGRAGRYLRDGTFGTLLPSELPYTVAQAIEAHVLPPLRRAYYRNASLAFDSIESLVESLKEPPKRRILLPYRDALDLATLERVAADTAVAELLTHQRHARVQLLWDVAQIPDYRKLLFESHAQLVKRLFMLLVDGPISDTEMEKSVQHLRKVEGDESILVDRIADTRTWTYVAHHASWVQNAGRWQEETRALEDALSEQLHVRLMSRFVDQGKRKQKLRPVNSFASLASLLALEAPPEPDGPYEPAPLTVNNRAEVLSGGVIVAQLSRGKSIQNPTARMRDHVDQALGRSDDVEFRKALEVHVQSTVRSFATTLLANAVSLREDPALRGLIYGLETGLGSFLVQDAHDELLALEASAREALALSGVCWGRVSVYAPASLSEEGLALRAALCAAWYGETPALTALAGRLPARMDGIHLALRGYIALAGFAVRLDVVEEGFAAVLEKRASLRDVAELLSLSKGEATAVLTALEARLVDRGVEA
jgi:ATP-dependent RNA helicase SUPV3L1/SUV3